MAFSDLGLVGAQFYTILSLMIVFWIVILVLFLLQQKHLQRKTGEGHARAISNVMVILGISICLMTMAWIICSASVKRDDLNIGRDASSLVISRDNIYTNFASLDPMKRDSYAVKPSKTTYPADTAICYPLQQASNGSGDGDVYHQKFFTLAHDYSTGKPFEIPYVTGSEGPDGTFVPDVGVQQFTDNMETQRRRTLAYYRFNYCLMNSMNQLITANSPFFNDWTTDSFRHNVVEFANQDKPSNGKGCLINNAVYVNIPDTYACLDPPGGNSSLGCSVPNPCFTAMIQTLSAQCLLHNDTVSNTLGGPMQGALESFGLGNGTSLTHPAP